MIRASLRSFTACYEAALKRNRDLAGKMEIHFDIDPAGEVVAAGIGDDAIHDAELAACTTAIMKSWRFPASSGGVKRFSYPFIFRSN